MSELLSLRVAPPILTSKSSNHLDSSARDWLATYLSKYEGSIILVSHDVALLSKGTSSIAEVSGKTLVKYVSCTYEKYLQEKEFRAKSAIAEYERNLKEAERLQVMSLPRLYSSRHSGPTPCFAGLCR